MTVMHISSVKSAAQYATALASSNWRLMISSLTCRPEHFSLGQVLATAYMQAKKLKRKEYSRLLSEYYHVAEMLLGSSEVSQAVSVTWLISFKEAEKQNALAIELLSLISFLDCRAIPMALLSHYSHTRHCHAEKNNHLGTQSNDDMLGEAIRILKSLSLIQADGESQLAVNEGVQLLTRIYLFRKGEAGHFARLTFSMLSALYPPGSYENCTVCSIYLPHVLCAWEHATTGIMTEKATAIETTALATLLHNTAGLYDYLGAWDLAEIFQSQALRIRKAVLGDEHAATVESMTNLGWIHKNQRRLSEAEILLEQALEAAQRNFGTHCPLALRIKSRLASTLCNQGQLEKAETLQVHIMQATSHVLGEEHPDTLTSMNNLAYLWENQGHYDRAVSLIEDCYLRRRKVLGEMHPDTLTSMNNLAFAWKGQGRRGEAMTMMKSCISRRLEVLGSSHPHTNSSLTALRYWEDDQLPTFSPA